MLRRLYDWVLDQAGKPGAIWVMAAISFTESSFFPLPPDLLLIPMILAERHKAFLYATVAMVSSVLGGFLGYAIGYYLFDSVGAFIIDHLVSQQAFASTKAIFDHYGFWAIVLKGMTPIPYKLVTILSGFLHFDLWSFALASVLARGMRFYFLAVLLYFFGTAVREFVEKRLVMVTTAFAVALVGAFLVLKVL
jgi:membrane protein YqaA with SNARE-associated domain